MHKMTFMALSIMLGASACKQSPEATHGVDTTLNDTADATEPVVENIQSTEDYAAEEGSEVRDAALQAAADNMNAAADRLRDDADTPTEEESYSNADQSREAAERGGPPTWLSVDDYPPSSVRAGEEGAVAMTWDINTEGRIENCQVTMSSGFASLDTASCQAMTRRGRYSPALDRSGTPIRSTGHARIRWALPE